MVAVVVDVAEAVAPALGRGVADALDHLLGQIAQRAQDAARAKGIALPAAGGSSQRHWSGRSGSKGSAHTEIMLPRTITPANQLRVCRGPRTLWQSRAARLQAEMTAETEQIRLAAAAFRYRNYRLFQAARFLVVTALEMQSVAVGWQIYEITRRPLDLGLVGLAQFMPALLLFLVGGHAADRFERRRVLLAYYTSFCLCSVALLGISLNWLDWPGASGAAHAPSSPAPFYVLVPAEVFPNAAAWGSSIFNAATILGPLIGGLLYALRASPIPVYLAASMTLATSVALMLAVRLQGVQQISRGDWKSVLAGLRYVWRNKLILGTTSLDLFAVLLGGAVALLPVFAREILHTGPRGLGILRAAPGIGAALTALAITLFPLRRSAGVKMLACVACFGAAT